VVRGQGGGSSLRTKGETEGGGAIESGRRGRGEGARIGGGMAEKCGEVVSGGRMGRGSGWASWVGLAKGERGGLGGRGLGVGR